MTAPQLCPECGLALVAVMTRVPGSVGQGHQKHVHYRCRNLTCSFKAEEPS